jgi:hypothetical protein
MKKYFQRLKKIWLLFAQVLGRVTTALLLTLVYFIIIGPMALIAKLLRKDLLQRKKNPLKTSYWLGRTSNEPTIERHKFQF